jgi:hypothetical protein
MGKSVLTPEESLLGKIMGQQVGGNFDLLVPIDNGGKGIRLRFRNLFVGSKSSFISSWEMRGYKAEDNGGSGG